MDAYSYVLSAIKNLGYICDTLPYLIDYQYGLFSRRLSKTRNTSIMIKATGRFPWPIFTMIINIIIPQTYFRRAGCDEER